MIFLTGSPQHKRLLQHLYYSMVESYYGIEYPTYLAVTDEDFLI